MKLEHLDVLWKAAQGPSAECHKLEDRLLLFALVFGLKPKRCLEIGTYRGGSAEILVQALDQCGEGRLVAIDPEPQISDATWERIRHRCKLIKAPSPEAIRSASRLVEGGQFDFVFIDGDHAKAYADIQAVLPYLAPGAYVLCHDCYFELVERDIDRALRTYPQLVDCGRLGTKRVWIDGHWWIGSQLLRFDPTRKRTGWSFLSRPHMKRWSAWLDRRSGTSAA